MNFSAMCAAQTLTAAWLIHYTVFKVGVEPVVSGLECEVVQGTLTRRVRVVVKNRIGPWMPKWMYPFCEQLLRLAQLKQRLTRTS